MMRAPAVLRLSGFSHSRKPVPLPLWGVAGSFPVPARTSFESFPPASRRGVPPGPCGEPVRGLVSFECADDALRCPVLRDAADNPVRPGSDVNGSNAVEPGDVQHGKRRSRHGSSGWVNVISPDTERGSESRTVAFESVVFHDVEKSPVKR